MCLLPGRSAATCKRTWLSLAWRSSHPRRRPPRCCSGRAGGVTRHCRFLEKRGRRCRCRGVPARLDLDAPGKCCIRTKQLSSLAAPARPSQQSRIDHPRRSRCSRSRSAAISSSSVSEQAPSVDPSTWFATGTSLTPATGAAASPGGGELRDAAIRSAVATRPKQQRRSVRAGARSTAARSSGAHNSATDADRTLAADGTPAIAAKQGRRPGRSHRRPSTAGRCARLARRRSALVRRPGPAFRWPRYFRCGDSAIERPWLSSGDGSAGADDTLAIAVSAALPLDLRDGGRLAGVREAPV